ncbi:hypothetical protein UFOVP806_43 [uncultured Caudovirales phage]|uniref:Uncharacterized protein n=1 Tax=uncultured Caudovirales phage TaxID=2100421 RepID=A0A6J5P307_9CAUD|nr:hypothetical protein UFOVP806_43 [uncultured Caudovirales phage]
MPYIHVTSFKEGLDSRRAPLTTTQGSMIVAENGHITRGGEFEKRKAFVPTFELPSGTFGLHATSSRLYTFGVNTPSSMPNGITFQSLVPPPGALSEMVEVISTASFNGLPYVVARYADGNVYHFYNGNRVTDWDNIAPDVTSLATLCSSVAELIDADPQVSAAHATVGATEVITITGHDVNNDFAISALFTNDVYSMTAATLDIVVAQPASPSNVKIVELVFAPSSAYEVNDRVSVTINGRQYTLTGAASGTGGPLLTYRGKLYTGLQSLLYFSNINNPTDWSNEGAGFINISNQTGGGEALTGIAPYQSFIAVMSRRTTQIWSVDPDPVLNRLVQILSNVGTIAPRSAIGFGEVDVFFLGDSGIRSLRARDSSNSAISYDVGTAIDTLVTKQMRSTTEQNVIRSCGVIEPVEGRYLLAIGDTIFVYSLFPASGISAWSTYKTGFNVDWFAAQGNKLFARSGNTVYLYGGSTGQQYDDCGVKVELSLLDAGRPPQKKTWTSLDMIADGTWKIEANFEPKTSNFDLLGYITDQNISVPSFTMQGEGTHLSLKFTHKANEYARLSAAICHFQSGETD